MLNLKKKEILPHLSFWNIFLLLVLFFCSSATFAKQSKKYHTSPNQLMEDFVTEYLRASYRVEDDETFEQIQRLFLSHQDILEKELVNELSKHPSLIEDEKTRHAMQVFIARGKGKEVAHTLLNQTATLLQIEAPIFKHFLFVDFAKVNGNRQRVEKRQEELKVLLEHQEETYKFFNLSKEAQKPFTTTLCYYSKEQAPYYFQTLLLALQGKATEKMFGPVLSNLMKQVMPNLFDHTQKEPHTAYISRFIFIESDFLGLLGYLQSFFNHAKRTKSIWLKKWLPSWTSIKEAWQAMINKEESSVSFERPTPFGATVFHWFFDLIHLPKASLFFLIIHVPLTLWYEFFGMNVVIAADALYQHIKSMIQLHNNFQQMSNELLEILPDIYRSYRMVKKVYFLLNKNPELQKTFKEEYAIIRQFCVSNTTRKIKKEIRAIADKIKRKKPIQWYEVWNPFFTLPSDLIATYTRLELVDREQHDKFKLAVLKATQIFYKSILARAISISSDLPLSIPTLRAERAEKHPCFEAKEAYTPLLIDTQSQAPIVKNDVTIGGDESTHVITGPNGGGKTTKLRLIASNMFIAPLGFICGKEGTYTLVGKIYYDANPEDSVKKGESLFTYEVKRAAEVYEYVKQSKAPVLILADEPFSKTAVRESQAFFAAYSIRLAELSCPTTFVSSTHLTELPYLVEKLGRKDFGFSKVEYIEGKGVTYKIIPGSVDEPLSNYILYELKYEPSIINLQEEILIKDPQFKWKEKLKGYKEKKKSRILMRILAILALLILLFALVYFLGRRYSIIIKRRK